MVGEGDELFSIQQATLQTRPQSEELPYPNGLCSTTVIICFFNAALYIQTALESLLNQTEKHFQALLINDGSSDNSLEVINRVIDSDPRFRVFTKKNGGIASARNFALPKLTSRYCMWLDADDTMEPEMIEKMNAAIHGYDLAVCGYNEIYPGYAKVISIPLGSTLKDLMDAQIRNTLWGVLWNKIFRVDLVLKYSISFVDGADMYEDKNFTLKYMSVCTSVKILDVSLYNYRRSSNDTVSNPLSYQKRQKNSNDIITNVVNAVQFIAQHNNQYVDLTFYKLTAKENLLYDDVLTSFKSWNRIFPEVNHDVSQSPNVKKEHLMLSHLAINNRWLALRVLLFFKRSAKKIKAHFS